MPIQCVRVTQSARPLSQSHAVVAWRLTTPPGSKSRASAAHARRHPRPAHRGGGRDGVSCARRSGRRSLVWRLQTARPAPASAPQQTSRYLTRHLLTCLLQIREAEALLAHNAEVVAALGEPVTFGPWWDASVTFSRGSNIVTAQYVLRGSKASADLRVGVVRPAGLEKHWAAGSAVLYTALGPGPAAWKVLMCDVTLPGGARGSGLPADRVDLLALARPRVGTVAA